MKSLRTLIHLACLALLLLGATACSSGDDGKMKGLPGNFNSMTDSEKVAWLMQRIPPDSVARFLYHAAMGDFPDVRIDTLAIATLYAYENYKDSALIAFSDEYEEYPSRLPLPKRMKAMLLAQNEDPINVGLSLGLEYVNQIRENNMTIQQIDAELASLKQVCGQDTAMYDRFLNGFRVALEADHGRNLKEEIYNKYHNIGK